MKVVSEAIMKYWYDSKVAVSTKVIPFDHVRMKSNKVLKLIQNSSVAKYLNEFRYLVLIFADY